MSAAVTTPDLQSLDADALRGLVLSQHRQLNAQNIEIENLKLLVAKLRREQFGSKSEKLDSHLRQLELELEDREIQQAAAPPAVLPSAADERRRPVRRPLPHVRQRGGIRGPGSVAARCPALLRLRQHPPREGADERHRHLPAGLARGGGA